MKRPRVRQRHAGDRRFSAIFAVRLLAVAMVTLTAAGCTKTPDPARALASLGLPEIDTELRPAAFKKEYTKRLEAVVAAPASNAARGDLAVFLHANDHLAEAAVLYDSLRASDPHSGRWPYYLARILQDQGQSERARALLDEAAMRAPDYALIQLRRADLLLKSGEARAAGSEYQAYLRRVPGSAHARLGLARIALQDEDWRAAETWLLEAQRHEPELASTQALLVTVYEALGEAANASRMRTDASAVRRYREPDDPWLDELVAACFDIEKLSVLAGIAIETGRVRHGMELLQRSREMDPTRARTALELAKAHLAMNDRAAALPLLADAIRLDPSLAEAHYALAAEWQAAGEGARALAVADGGVRHNPRNAGLQRQRGIVLQASGRHTEAEAALERAVALDPTDVKNAEALGNFYWAMNRKDAASAQFENARALSPLAVKARAILGGYYLERDRVADAERCIAEAFAVEPGLEGLDELRAVLHVRRGNAFFQAGDAARAEEAYRQALAARPEHEESLTNLIAVWLRTDRAREARALLTNFVAEHPKATFAYPLAARVAAQAGDRAAALGWVARGLEVARTERDLRQEHALLSLRDRLQAPAR